MKAYAVICIDNDAYETRKLVSSAITLIGWRINKITEKRIIATAGLSIASFGESITFDFLVDGAATIVRIKSANWQVIDWGKNRRNIKRIIKVLGGHVQAHNSNIIRFCTSCNSALGGRENVCAACGKCDRTTWGEAILSASLKIVVFVTVIFAVLIGLCALALFLLTHS